MAMIYQHPMFNNPAWTPLDPTTAYGAGGALGQGPTPTYTPGAYTPQPFNPTATAGGGGTALSQGTSSPAESGLEKALKYGLTGASLYGAANWLGDALELDLLPSGKEIFQGGLEWGKDLLGIGGPNVSAAHMAIPELFSYGADANPAFINPIYGGEVAWGPGSAGIHAMGAAPGALTAAGLGAGTFAPGGALTAGSVFGTGSGTLGAGAFGSGMSTVAPAAGAAGAGTLASMMPVLGPAAVFAVPALAAALMGDGFSRPPTQAQLDIVRDTAAPTPDIMAALEDQEVAGLLSMAPHQQTNPNTIHEVVAELERREMPYEDPFAISNQGMM